MAKKEPRQDEQDEYALAAGIALSQDSAIPHESLSALGLTLLAEFKQAELDRRETELRWLQDLRQYRGIYDPEILDLIGNTRSRAFVRKTRVKVKTVDARMGELLFPGNAERNFHLEPTPVPEISPEIRKAGMAQLTQKLQRPPNENEIQEAIKAGVDQAAKAMTKTIDDQLNEAKYKDVARSVIHSGNLYGTGVLKAPLVERKIRTRFIKQGENWSLKTESYVVPFVDYVPLWRFYPDMAATTIDDCRYVYERHLMTKAGVFKLAERKSFKKRQIIDYLAAHPDGEIENRHFDSELKQIGERATVAFLMSGQYEVIERWGWLSGQQLADHGAKIPKDRLGESFFSNVWLLPNGEVIRAVLQPINGVTWPYHLYYFDKDETSLFGEGLAAIMRDDQTMLNAGIRMILDNAALAAGTQFEVNTKLIRMTNEKIQEVYPFKIWPRTGEDPGTPAIRTIDIQSHLPELQQIVTMFENNADEVTAIPRYMSGESVNNGAAGTASGMSMLMGAASVVMKDLITSFDEGVTRPFIEALYRWNMQFNSNSGIKGDFDIKASGTASMIAKEVRAQQLDAFSQLAANPLDAPFIKRDKLLRQRAEAHDLTDVVKTEDEVAAEQNNPMMQQQMQMQQVQQEIAMKTMQATLAKLEAEVLRIRAEAINKNVASAYAAMQAGGVAVQSPDVAPAGDEILRSAGWQDATPTEDTADAVGTNPVPMAEAPSVQPQPDSGGAEVGMHKGIRTAALDG
jgi:hypothetical protein